MAIHVHYDDEGRLTETQHFLYEQGGQLYIRAGVNKESQHIHLVMGGATVYLTPAQAENVVAHLAGAIAKVPLYPPPVVVEVSV